MGFCFLLQYYMYAPLGHALATPSCLPFLRISPLRCSSGPSPCFYHSNRLSELIFRYGFWQHSITISPCHLYSPLARCIPSLFLLHLQGLGCILPFSGANSSPFLYCPSRWSLTDNPPKPLQCLMVDFVWTCWLKLLFLECPLLSVIRHIFPVCQSYYLIYVFCVLGFLICVH